MKKIVLLLCLIISLISYNYLFGFSAGFMGSGGGAPAGAPACETEQQVNNAADHGNNSWGQYSANRSIGTQFVANDTYTVCKVIVSLYEGGTITTGTIIAEIYADSGDDITGSPIGGSSNAMDATDLTGTSAEYTLDGMAASLTNTNTYWLVLTWNGTADETNYPVWDFYQFTGFMKQGNQSTLDQGSQTRTGWFELYK